MVYKVLECVFRDFDILSGKLKDLGGIFIFFFSLYRYDCKRNEDVESELLVI